ncbi:MAG: ABC transporter permease [Actinomycetota bacterium]|nr:ABC transporter permease [Actinomycetota bacterium]
MSNNTNGNLSSAIKTPVSSRLKSIFMNQQVFLIILMIIIGVVVTIVNPNFLSVQNLFNIVLQVSVLGIISVGVSMILITGEFDLSVGPMISVLGLVFAIVIIRYNTFLAIVAVMLLGMIIGAVNGFFVTRIKAHSFIITLALATVYTGAALLISGGKYIALQGRFKFFVGRLFGVIPYPTIVFVIILILLFLTLRYIKFGRLLFAVGGNVEAAYLSGIKVRLYKTLVYSIAGGLYGIATIVLISQISVAYPTTGDPYTLNALAAVVVGGIALTGGKGSALGVFLGVVVFGLINNSMVIMNLDPFWREVVLGLIILLAVTISGISSKE